MSDLAMRLRTISVTHFPKASARERELIAILREAADALDKPRMIDTLTIQMTGGLNCDCHEWVPADA